MRLGCGRHCDDRQIGREDKMADKKFKIGSAFREPYDSGDFTTPKRVDDDTETYGAWGTSSHWVTKEDIQHLLNGGILMIEDGEYEHYLKMKPDDDSNLSEQD